MKLLLLLILAFCFGIAIKTCGENIVVVRNGQLKDGLEITKKWTRGKGFLSCQGAPDILASRYLVKSDKFRIKARLSIKMGGTAAGIKINNSLFGFDGGNNCGLFLEGPGFAKTAGSGGNAISPSKQCIKDQQAFDLEITVENKKVKFSIDGNLIWSGDFEEKGSCLIALRPQRALMKLYDFEIEGSKAGKTSLEKARGIKLITPIDIKPKSILSDLKISLPEGIKDTSDLTFSLKARGNKRSVISCPAVISENKISITPDQLAKAYKSCRIKFLMRPVLLTVKKDRRIIFEIILNLFDPSKKTDFAKSKIVMKQGNPDAYINDKVTGILRGFVARDQGKDRYLSRSVRQFYQAGIHDFIIWVRPSRFAKNGIMDKKQFYNHVTELISRVVADAPKAYITLYWQLYMPVDWCHAHPNELIRLDVDKQSLRNAPGRYPQPSYASKVWRREAGDFLRDMLETFKISPVGDRIAAVKVTYGNCGEWNHWGYHEKAFVDFSNPMQKAFGKWLKNKYKTEDKLRSAWGRGDVSFDSDNLVPDRANRMGFQNGLLRIVPEAQATVDYYQFFQLMTVETIEYFAKIIKKASKKRLLVGAFYGYFLQHLTGQPYHFQDAGSYALERYLKSPYLDFLGGPYPYGGRRQNAVVQGVFSSVALHKKLWESEGDQRTHYSGTRQKYFGTTSNLAESIAIAKRDFMMNMSKRGSYYFFDFVLGWYRDSGFMKTIMTLRKIDKFSMKTGRKNCAQVAVFVSEKDVPWMGSRKNHGLTLFRYTFTHFMDMAGAPWEMFLMSDLEKVNLSKYKFIMFANVLKVTDNQLTYIKSHVRSGGRTVLFLYAPGIIGNGGKLDLERSRQMTGIKIGVKPNEKFRRLNASIPKDKAYLHVHHKFAGEFMTYIDDPETIELFHFQKNKLPGAAMRKFGSHTSIVFCFPGINSMLLRRMYRQAKVHVWNQIGYDKMYTAGPFISLFSNKKGGKRKITLPYIAEIIVDLFSGEVIARNSQIIDFTMKEGPDCRIFYAGNKSLYQKYYK